MTSILNPQRLKEKIFGKKVELPEAKPVVRLPTVDKTAMKKVAAETAQGGRASTMLSVLAKKKSKKLGN